MHVPRDGPGFPWPLEQHRLEPSLKERTDTLVPPIEPNAVGRLQPMHRGTEVCFQGGKHHMKGILHQRVGVHLHPVALAHDPQQFQQLRLARRLPEQRPPFDPTGRHMIPSARQLNSQGSRHAAIEPPAATLRQM